MTRLFLLSVIALVTASPSPSSSPASKPTGSEAELRAVRATTDRFAQRLRSSKMAKRNVKVESETDGGASLVLRGSPNGKAWASLSVGLSTAVVRTDYYFKKGHLVLVAKQLLKYRIGSDGVIHHDKTPVKAGEARYYLESGKGITYVESDRPPESLFGVSSDGRSDLQFGEFLLRNWDVAQLDLASWIRNGTLPPGKHPVGATSRPERIDDPGRIRGMNGASKTRSPTSATSPSSRPSANR